MIVDKVFVFISHIKTLAFCINEAKNLSILRQVALRIMNKCNKQYIVVKSQYVLHILQFIPICFWQIVTAFVDSDENLDLYLCWILQLGHLEEDFVQMLSVPKSCAQV